MAKEIYLTIDGKQITATEGSNLVDVAKENNIFIPSLCYFTHIEPPLGTCRTCTCLVNGKYQPACTEKVNEGMEVEVNTSELVDMRKALVEMMFSEGNHFCPACEKSGHCDLQHMGYELGVSVSRFPHLFKDRVVDYHPRRMIMEHWSYMKFPFITSLGREKGWNRVGPLARMNVCVHIPTPLAEAERKEFFEMTGTAVNNRTMYTHWARLIEMLHMAECIGDLLNDPVLDATELVRQGTPRTTGIGIIEAPRGTLTHHYEVDEKGMIKRCNLIVSTTHNNEPMNRAVRWVAQHVIDRQGSITEGMLNQIEVAIRAYDPCLSCATQALGKMPLQVELFDANHNLLQTVIKNSHA